MEKPINKWSVNGNDRLMSHRSQWRMDSCDEAWGDQLMWRFFVAAQVNVERWIHKGSLLFPEQPWNPDIKSKALAWAYVCRHFNNDFFSWSDHKSKHRHACLMQHNKELLLFEQNQRQLRISKESQWHWRKWLLVLWKWVSGNRVHLSNEH